MLIAEAIQNARADTVVITLPESIAWLLNIRGGDVKHTPVPHSFATLGTDGQVGNGITGYLLPFEIVSVHLLVVLVGAAYLARAKRRRGAENVAVR